MTYLELYDKVFNTLKEQRDYADGLDYAMGEVFANEAQRITALRNMLLSFIDELEDLDWELNQLEEDK